MPLAASPYQEQLRNLCKAGKRLIVFGCGYIGGEIARQAVARGMRVTGLTRNPVKAEVWRKSGIEMIIADLAARGWHEDIAGGADFVLNCVSSGGGGIAGYRRSYVEGMDSVLTWARDRGAVGTLVYTSSTSVYSQDGYRCRLGRCGTGAGGEHGSGGTGVEKIAAGHGVGCEGRRPDWRPLARRRNPRIIHDPYRRSPP